MRAELHDLLHSWEYAFAMGHSCTYDPDPRLDHIRDQVRELQAMIKEHEG